MEEEDAAAAVGLVGFFDEEDEEDDVAAAAAGVFFVDCTAAVVVLFFVVSLNSSSSSESSSLARDLLDLTLLRVNLVGVLAEEVEEVGFAADATGLLDGLEEGAEEDAEEEVAAAAEEEEGGCFNFTTDPSARTAVEKEGLAAGATICPFGAAAEVAAGEGDLCAIICC